MNEKLASIFVPVEVAKLAKEKGFNEWCACLYVKEIGCLPNDDNNFDWDFEFINNGVFIELPTHYQLIKWLNTGHEIDLVMVVSGLFRVEYVLGSKNNKDWDTCFEINEALIVALNLIKVKEEITYPELIEEHYQNI